MNYNYMIINAICIALVFVFSSILHELAHLIMCIILRCKVKEFKIFFLKFTYENSKCKIFIDIKDNEHCSFYSKNLKKVIIIMVSGPVMNFILAVIFGIMLYFVKNFIYFCGCVYNIILVISNIAFESKGDGYYINMYLKQIRKDEKK